MTFQPKLLFFCILLESVHFSLSQDTWVSPYFSKPENSTVTVRNVSSDRTVIEFNEEITPPFVIADITYFGSTVPSITNIDGDGTNSTLGIIAQQSSSNQWHLIVTIRQDYESNIHLYSFTVTIGQVSKAVDIAVDNIHDNAPTILPQSKTCHINETFIGQSSCKFVVEDVDGDVTKLNVTVDAGDANKDIFRMTSLYSPIDSNHEVTMALSVDKPLDYETQDLYSITITAQCTLGTMPLQTSVIIIVQVDDLPDEPPKFIKYLPVVTINEKSNVTVQVEAIDGDTGINANISYTILNVTDNLSSFVHIDNTGRITIDAIDRDLKNVNSFEITVLAYETLEPYSNASVVITVMVTDLDDHSPIIQPAFLTAIIQERRPSTLKFDSQINISDPDLGENGSFNVELVSTSPIAWNEAFEVVPSYGYQTLVVTVATTNYSLLDYNQESWRNITLQLIATEIANSSHKGIATVNIQLTPVNDRYPEFVGLPYVHTVKETIGKGEVVLRVNATDEDFGDKIIYKMDSSVLEVDTSGVITVAKDDAFDYERQKVVEEVVQAVDAAGHVTYAQITINVIDVDDTPPTLTLPSELLKVKENSKIETVITNNITASDPDTNASLVFRLDWTVAGATKQGVAVNISQLIGCLEIKTQKVSAGKWSGEMVVKHDVLDYEKFDTLFVTIVVRDVNTEVNDAERSAIVSIEIEDVNDNSPVFNTLPELSVEENSITGKLIGSVTAKDADGPMFNSVSYSLENVAPTPTDLVKIDPTTGALTVVNNIDCEQIQTLVYIVIASDGENLANVTISITVIDENDNIPIVKSPNTTNYMVTIPEESLTGTSIFNISASDADYSEPYHNITYLINYQDYPDLENYFYIEPYTGYLQVKLQGVKTLDRDTGVGRYVIYLILRDNYEQYSLINSNHIEQMLTVALSDINDNAPVFPNITGFLFSVKESLSKGTLLLDHLQATDIDEGDNAQVTYSILNTTAESDVRNIPQENLFNVTTVNDTYAQIYANTDLESHFGTYTIFLKAEDHGSPSRFGIKDYQVYIEDVNDNAPQFVNPKNNSMIYIRDVQTVGSKVLDRSGKELPAFYATDQDTGDNARISYYLNGSALALTYFSITTDSDNSTSLVSMRSLDKDNVSSVQLTLEAVDHGSPPLSNSVYSTLLVIATVEQEPQFSQSTWITQFTENTLTEEVLIPEAMDRNNVNKEPAEYQEVYYFIVGDESNELFQLNSTSRTLHLRMMLDREQLAQHVLTVVTTNNVTGPPQTPSNSSVLTITVNVIDVNDCPPTFQQRLYAGGIQTSDDKGKVILTVKATDPDLNDRIRYSQDSVLAVSDTSLSSHTSDGILLNSTGEIILNFKPQVDMKGYFYFNITAKDLVGHTDSAHVQVYLISSVNFVKFTFINPLELVNSRRNQIENIFTYVFGYKGTVDSVTKAVDDNQQVIANATEVKVHFIDTSKNLPVNAQQILQQAANRDTIINLRTMFSSNASLALEDLQAQTDSQTVPAEGIQSWMLYFVTVAIMATFLVLLIGLYIWKTRSLQDRLDRMAAASSMETHNDTSKNITLSTANLYEKKTNPVLGLNRSVFVIDKDDIDTYIDEALQGLEEKLDEKLNTSPKPPETH